MDSPVPLSQGQSSCSASANVSYHRQKRSLLLSGPPVSDDKCHNLLPLMLLLQSQNGCLPAVYRKNNRATQNPDYV